MFRSWKCFKHNKQASHLIPSVAYNAPTSAINFIGETLTFYKDMRFSSCKEHCTKEKKPIFSLKLSVFISVPLKLGRY